LGAERDLIQNLKSEENYVYFNNDAYGYALRTPRNF